MYGKVFGGYYLCDGVPVVAFGLAWRGKGRGCSVHQKHNRHRLGMGQMGQRQRAELD